MCIPGIQYKHSSHSAGVSLSGLIWSILVASALASGSGMAESTAIESEKSASSWSEKARDLAVGIGGFMGAGLYRGSAIQKSLIKKEYVSRGWLVEAMGRRYGLMISQDSQSSAERVFGDELYRVGLNSKIVRVGLIREFDIRSEKHALQVRSGVAHARRDFVIKDDYLKKEESHTTFGGFAGVLYKYSFDERLSFQGGLMASLLPVKVEILDLNDPGLQTNTQIGLTLSF